jgi:hypothetical protein
MSCCSAGANGRPEVCPRGKSTNAARGGLTDAVIVRHDDSVVVGMPAASRARAIRPTV